MSLRELQQRFGAAVMDGAPADGLVRVDHMDVYRHAYVARLVDVLGDVYPRTAKRADDWDDLAREYVRRHPSRSPSLRSFGSELASLLGDRDLASLARLEWARYDLFDALDEPPLTREQLAADVARPLRRIVASRILELPHDADALWHERPSTGPVTLLVWRDDLTLFHRVLDENEARCLGGQSSVETLAELLGDAAATFELVGRWLADRLLAGNPE